jgi:hypothetical protein
MKKILIMAVLGLGFSSCAHKVRLLDASAVSMTKKHGVKGVKAADKGAANGEACYDSSASGTIGLMDNAIKAAQKSSGADYIADATFYAKGSCVTVEGTAMTYRK